MRRLSLAVLVSAATLASTPALTQSQEYGLMLQGSATIVNEKIRQVSLELESGRRVPVAVSKIQRVGIKQNGDTVTVGYILRSRKGAVRVCVANRCAGFPKLLNGSIPATDIFIFN